MSPVADSPLKVESSQPSPKKLKADGLAGAAVTLQIAVLSENATIPTRGSARAAGYDLYSAEVGIILNSTSSSSNILSCHPRTSRFPPEARDSSRLISRSKFPAEPTAGLLPALDSPGKTTSTSGPESWTRITEEMSVSSSSVL